MKNSFLIFCLFACLSASAQQTKPFSGRLIYRIEFLNSLDSVPVVQSRTKIYTNDTLVRVESESPQFGPQVLIKHLQLQKYYLLLEYDSRKYAIQHHVDKDTLPSKYTFKKKWGSKKIAGQKAKCMLVSATGFPRPVKMWYLPSVSPKFLDAVKGMPGLPADYYIRTEDGFLHYVLESFERAEVNKDLFGLPSDFKKVSFDEFLEEMMPKD